MTPTKPALVPVQHRIPVNVKAWIAEEARRQERSANWLVCRILQQAMNAAGATSEVAR